MTVFGKLEIHEMLHLNSLILSTLKLLILLHNKSKFIYIVVFILEYQNQMKLSCNHFMYPFRCKHILVTVAFLSFQGKIILERPKRLSFPIFTTHCFLFFVVGVDQRLVERSVTSSANRTISPTFSPRGSSLQLLLLLRRSIWKVLYFQWSSRTLSTLIDEISYF